MHRFVWIFTVICCVSISCATTAGESDAVKSDSLPVRVDLRPEFERLGLRPRAQGSRNTCSVFVTTETLEFALAKNKSKGQPLSVEFLNWACNEVVNNHTDDRGQFFHNLLAGFGKYGICYESQMPYIDHFDPPLSPNDDAKQTAATLRQKPFRVHWIKHWVANDSGLDASQMMQVKSALAKGLPVAAGSDHSRLFVGYTDVAHEDGGGTFITMDSGLGGYGSVTYEFARTKVNDAFWIELD